MNNKGNEIDLKFFNIDGEVILSKEVPFKKFRFMKELDLLLKDQNILEDNIDIVRTINYLNENNECLRIKSMIVVDDEFVLRDLYKAQIARFGHYVEVFESAKDALNKFEENPLRYDLIISDNIMPEMKGDELADKIKEVKPDTPVYIITGDSDSVDEESFNNSVSGLITKPINAEKLKNFLGEGKVDLFLRDEFKVEVSNEYIDDEEKKIA
jgi:CheY-like chemotaxis protein